MKPETAPTPSENVSSDLAGNREIARWFYEDGVKRYMRPIRRAILYEAIAIAAQLFGLFVIFRYAAALERGSNRHLAQLGLNPRRSMALLLGVAGTSAVALGIHAWLSHKATLIALRLRVNYEEVCLRRGIVYYGSLPNDRAPKVSAMVTDGTMSTGAAREARAVSRVLDLLVRAVRQVGMVALFLIGLLYVSPLLSLGVLVIAAVGGVQLYRINRSQAELSHEADQGHYASAVERKALLRMDEELVLSHPEVERAFGSGGMRQYLDAFYALEAAKLRSTTTLEALASVSVALIVVASGAGIVAGTWSLSRLVVYIVLLRYFLSASRKVGKFFANVAAVRASIGRYHLLVTEHEEGLP